MGDDSRRSLTLVLKISMTMQVCSAAWSTCLEWCQSLVRELLLPKSFARCSVTSTSCSCPLWFRNVASAVRTITAKYFLCGKACLRVKIIKDQVSTSLSLLEC